mmetsp:Transcript_8698/g.12982  ORF Transcript_8698/g.12982 Transcript_8698/m.12982 type:complete len:115 (-) Transcript_8698:282-626(-)|eukprot:CAMPEP_0185021876 /NCGR_PEP_ID=MMETSP1103-20130426/4581_1 /TAXON_ID=36769 /ORGANISM="Paraphysomonas bandaiensis, Strain Caron Lab Isolate" /LENGTH=114 /DNA_ID=CAMNT_0027553655 /DNA_START=56 /DNA_END=400 /DNA_ORIENTATION=-
MSTNSADNVEVNGKSSEDMLTKLEELEKDIASILQVAEETVHELDNLPHCDVKKLENLSEKYLSLIADVKRNALEGSKYLKPYRPYGQGNYALRRQVEVAHASSVLEDAYKDIL